MGRVPPLTQRTGDGLVAVDHRQRIVSWNTAASRMLGHPESRTLGRPCYEVLQCFDDSGRSLCATRCFVFQSMCNGEELASHELVLQRADGSNLKCSLSFLAIDDGAGLTQAFFLIRPHEKVEAPVDFEERWWAELAVRCFGSFEVSILGNTLTGPPLTREKAGRALRLLVHRRGQKVSRDELAEALWPRSAPDTARSRLKVIMHALRRTLEPTLATPKNSRFIRYENDSYFFLSDGCSIDVDIFLERVREGRECQARGALDEARTHYLEATKLYRGDYLTEDLYEDWSAGERQYLRETHISILMALASFYAVREEHGRAADCCWRALADDACRESVYRNLMDYLYRDGRLDEAIRTYHRCEAALHRELGLQPQAETVDLYRRIKTQINGASP